MRQILMILVIEVPNFIIEREDLIRTIFGAKLSLQTKDDISVISNKIIWTTKNIYATEFNDKILNLIEGETYEYFSTDSIISDDINDAIDFPIEFLNTLCPSGMPPFLLKLKIGAFVILLRN